MNDKNLLVEKDSEQAQGTRVSGRSIPGAIIAAIVCLLLALVVWIGVMNTRDTDYIPVRVTSPAGYTCTLSVDGVEVEGTVSALKGLNEIVVNVSAEDAAYVLGYFNGTASVNEALLRLPEGVSLTENWNAVLTVKAK